MCKFWKKINTPFDISCRDNIVRIYLCITCFNEYLVMRQTTQKYLCIRRGCTEARNFMRGKVYDTNHNELPQFNFLLFKMCNRHYIEYKNIKS